MIGGGDPVDDGLIQSMAHPGGNLTGITILAPQVDAKRLELLHEALPELKRVAYVSPRSRDHSAFGPIEAMAKHLGIELDVFVVDHMEHFPSAIDEVRARGHTAGVIGYTTLYAQRENARKIAALAIDAKIVTICEWDYMAEEGCVLGYGTDLRELYSRAAKSIHRILGGTPPSEVPFEAPTRFRLAVNLKTAKALVITFPASIMVRADEVIE
jgi:putative ABC transport system substrate-binding protein